MGPHSLGVASFTARNRTELERIVGFATRVYVKGQEDRGHEIAQLIGVRR